MTDSISALDWETVETRHQSIFSGYARVGVPLVEQHCRHCGGLIHSRRQAHCGYCSQPLPVSTLFNPEQSEAISNIITEERQRHREWLRRH